MNPTTAQSVVRRFLELIFQPGDVFEVRAPNCRERRDARYAFTCSGYFTSETIETAVTAIMELDRPAIAPGIYVTINPVAPALLARAANRIKPRARETTQDKDIVRRRWLLIDVDPVRPTGVSATDAELAMALDRTRAIGEYLASVGWPAPIFAMSGNGYHLLYRIDVPADDGGLLKAVLTVLAERFSDAAVAVDRSVHNPARIVKVIGTVPRKGDDLRGVAGLEDRPHRRSELLDVPERIGAVAEDADGFVAPSNLPAFRGHAGPALKRPQDAHRWPVGRRTAPRRTSLRRGCPGGPGRHSCAFGGQGTPPPQGESLSMCNRSNAPVDAEASREGAGCG